MLCLLISSLNSFYTWRNLVIHTSGNTGRCNSLLSKRMPRLTWSWIANGIINEQVACQRAILHSTRFLNFRVVSTYLVHHGYCQTAEAFAKSTGQSITEEIASIKNRQSEYESLEQRGYSSVGSSTRRFFLKTHALRRLELTVCFIICFCPSGLQKLVLSGRISEAIEATQSLYPGLLDRNLDLLFILKCRQFIEMVTGCDSEVKPSAHSPTRSAISSPCGSPARNLTHASTGTTSSLATNGYKNTDLSQHSTVDSFQEVTGNGVMSDTGNCVMIDAGNGVISDTGNGVIVDDDMDMADVSNSVETSTPSVLNAQSMPSTSHATSSGQSYSSSPRGCCCCFFTCFVEIFQDLPLPLTSFQIKLFTFLLSWICCFHMPCLLWKVPGPSHIILVHRATSISVILHLGLTAVQALWFFKLVRGRLSCSKVPLFAFRAAIFRFFAAMIIMIIVNLLDAGTTQLCIVKAKSDMYYTS